MTHVHIMSIAEKAREAVKILGFCKSPTCHGVRGKALQDASDAILLALNELVHMSEQTKSPKESNIIR